ncbi:helix-turn-helix domain-containing protein [Trichocoleus desertorum AS-A10]
MIKDLMNIEELRQRAGLTAERIAESCGKSSGTIRNWEAGRSIPKLEPREMMQVLAAYQCTLEEFSEAIDVSRTEQKRKKPGRKPGDRNL